MSERKDPRVLFAAERTLLAWNRTCLSLITFGFALERVGFLTQGTQTSGAHYTLTFFLGLSFTVLGTVSAGYSVRQFMAVLREVSPADIPPGYGTKWGSALSWLVAALGACTTAALVIGRLM